MAFLAASFARTVKAPVAAQATAGTAQTTTLCRAPFTGRITAVRLLPHAAVAFNASNYRTFEIRNEGTDGTGTAAITNPATANNGTSATALTGQVARSLSVAAANASVVEGDIISVVEAALGTGVAHGGYGVEVEFSRDA